MKLSIPKPCYENWNEMTPATTGRFCGSCEKTVVDFTNKSEQEIKSYLNANQSERTCGRFRADQLSVTEKEEVVKSWYIKRFAIAAYLVFGFTLFSCTASSQENIPEIETGIGQVIIPDTIPSLDTVHIQQDTAKQLPVPPMQIMGEIEPIRKPVVMGELIAEPIEKPNSKPKECGVKPHLRKDTNAVDTTKIHHPIKMGKVRLTP